MFPVLCGSATTGVGVDRLADYICERPLPSYASAFRLDRYQDAGYARLLEQWSETGQL